MPLGLFQFATAAVSNYFGLGRVHQLITFWDQRSEAKTHLPGLVSRCPRDRLLSGDSGENSFSWLFQLLEASSVHHSAIWIFTSTPLPSTYLPFCFNFEEIYGLYNAIVEFILTTIFLISFFTASLFYGLNVFIYGFELIIVF